MNNIHIIEISLDINKKVFLYKIYIGNRRIYTLLCGFDTVGNISEICSFNIADTLQYDFINVKDMDINILEYLYNYLISKHMKFKKDFEKSIKMLMRKKKIEQFNG